MKLGLSGRIALVTTASQATGPYNCPVGHGRAKMRMNAAALPNVYVAMPVLPVNLGLTKTGRFRRNLERTMRHRSIVRGDNVGFPPRPNRMNRVGHPPNATRSY